jgi:hypothetical protein
LRAAIGRHHQREGERKTANIVLMSQRKNWFSVCLYAASVPLAYSSVWVSFGIFVLIPVMYFMPASFGDTESAATHLR